MHSVLRIQQREVVRVFVHQVREHSFFQHLIVADYSWCQLLLVPHQNHLLNAPGEEAEGVGPGGLRCLVEYADTGIELLMMVQLGVDFAARHCGANNHAGLCKCPRCCLVVDGQKCVSCVMATPEPIEHILQRFIGHIPVEVELHEVLDDFLAESERPDLRGVQLVLVRHLFGDIEHDVRQVVQLQRQ